MGKETAIAESACRVALCSPPVQLRSNNCNGDTMCAPADAIPIVLRVVFSQNFSPGPFQLGSLHTLINVAAVCWTGIGTVSAPTPHLCFTSFIFDGAPRRHNCVSLICFLPHPRRVCWGWNDACWGVL